MKSEGNFNPSSEKTVLNNKFPNYGEAEKVGVEQKISFNEFFRDSKVVDTEGNPRIVYHGSLQAFSEFDSTNMGGESGQMGAGHYFSDSTEDVNINYAGKGKDLGHKILKEAVSLSYLISENPDKYTSIVMDVFGVSEGEALGKIQEAIDDTRSVSFMHKYKGEMYEGTAVVRLAKKIKEMKYKPTEGVIYPSYLRIEKPVFFKKKEGTVFSDADIDKFRAYIEEVAREHDIDAEKLLKPLSSSASDLKVDSWKLYSKMMESKDWFDIKSSNSNLPMTGQFFANMCIKAGYDGMVINAFDSFLGDIPKIVRVINKKMRRGMKGVDDAKHYVVWDSSQIRSAVSS